MRAQPGWGRPDGKSVLVYGALIQDAFSAAAPNRAFWSIAVEAQLYGLLPLLLLVRRVNARAMVVIVAGVVVSVGVLVAHVRLLNNEFTRFTPDLAVLFAIGVLALASSRRASATVLGAGLPSR